MKFSEIANRLTGISRPFGGASWQPAEMEVAAARRAIAFLEDWRVLCVPTEPILWQTEKYRDFLQFRRTALAKRMNEFIKEKAGQLHPQKENVPKQVTPEVVLRVGSEGGTITLLRENSGEGWHFRTGTDETTMSFLLDEEDLKGMELRNSSPVVKTWEEALAQLDRYRWAGMVPLQVHPDCREAVLAAVRNRLGQDADSRHMLAKWEKAEVTKSDLVSK